MKFHLVYAVPFTNRSLVSRIKRKSRHILGKIGLPVVLLSNRQPTEKDFESWPVKSPYENTRNLYRALSEKAPTFLYHLTERVHCHFEADDVFIGHPFFPHSKGGYGVTEMAVREKIRPRKFALISPLHCDVSISGGHINREFLHDIDKLMPYVDVLFAIMGEYWWEQWDSSPFAHWKSKMVRLDMAVDVQRYPRVKKRFNKPGQRGYLYIGVNEPRKGPELLAQLMELVGDYPKGWIGNGPEIPNVPRISTAQPLTPEFMKEIAKKYDFFISPSRADPNPTTILESMAWGFPVVCTPQSGYYETSYRPNIYRDDIDKSVNILRHLQYASETELMKMADEARKVVKTDYTWGKFTSKVIRHLDL